MIFKTKAFTIVELVIVVVILSVLWTIGFVSYTNYLSWVRDTVRLMTLESLSEWLDLYSVNHTL